MLDKSFLGRGWSFPPEFNKASSSVTMVSNEEDIKESLRILLATHPGERRMHEDYGCHIRDFIFEDLDSTGSTLLKEEIRKAILMHEPRITLDKITIEHNKDQEGKLELHISYTVRLTNNRSNIVYPFYFKEGTDLH